MTTNDDHIYDSIRHPDVTDTLFRSYFIYHIASYITPVVTDTFVLFVFYLAYRFLTNDDRFTLHFARRDGHLCSCSYFIYVPYRFLLSVTMGNHC